MCQSSNGWILSPGSLVSHSFHLFYFFHLVNNTLDFFVTKTAWLLKIYKVFCDTKYMSKSPNMTMPGGWWCNVRLISQLCFSVWLWLPSIFLASYLLPHKTSWDVIKTFLRKIKISSKIFFGWWRLLSLNPARSPASQDLVKYFLQRRWKIFNIEYIELDSLHKRMLNAVIPQIYPRR